MAHDPIKRLIEELSKLPGIGERTAMRLALHLLGQNREAIYALADSLTQVANHVRECEDCCNLTAFSDKCSICLSDRRDDTKVCLVATIQDLMAIETSQAFRGLYHVLHGVLQPIMGVGPEKLRFSKLLGRLKNGQKRIQELILATPSTIEGEATALYAMEQCRPFELIFSRIASGVPVGGDLQFADRLSLSRALTMRQTCNQK